MYAMYVGLFFLFYGQDIQTYFFLTQERLFCYSTTFIYQRYIKAKCVFQTNEEKKRIRNLEENEGRKSEQLSRKKSKKI